MFGLRPRSALLLARLAQHQHHHHQQQSTAAAALGACMQHATKATTPVLPPPPAAPRSRASFPLAFAAAAALAAASINTAHARDDKHADDGEGAASLAAQRRTLSNAYEEAVADWHRHAAQAPRADSAAAAAAPPRPPPLPRPPSLSRGPNGATVATIPVRPGADVAHVVAELGAGVKRLSAAAPRGGRAGAAAADEAAATATSVVVRQRSSASGVARTWRWDVTTTRVGDPPARATLAVQAYVPRQGTGAHGPGGLPDPERGDGGEGQTPPGSAPAASASGGEVVVTKTGAPLTPDELELVCRAAHAATATFAGGGGGGGGDGSGGGGGGSGGDSLPALLQRRLLAEAERLVRERGLLPWLFGGGAGGAAGDDSDDEGDGDDDGHDEAAEALEAWLNAIFGGGGGGVGGALDDNDDGIGGAGGGGWFPLPVPLPFPPPPFSPRSAAPGADGDASKARPLPPSPSPPPLPPPPPPPAHGWGSVEAQAAVRRLETLGARVFPPTPSPALSLESPLALNWGSFAGYAAQKRAIEDGLLLPLLRPDVFDRLAARTRRRPPGSSDGDKAGAAGSDGTAPARARPRAVLFEGPPGTGKTTSARVLTQAGVPLVYVPVESLTSRWYGDSEKNVATLFREAEKLGGAVLFLDELDSLAPSREDGGGGGGGGGIHEASRRLLGVLLREIDGFDTAGGEEAGAGAGGAGGAGVNGSGSGNGSPFPPSPPPPRRGSVVIGATNRSQDLDPALLSRFSLTLHFGLPDADTRDAILQRYAAQLADAPRRAVAEACAGFSGRDLRDVCEVTERRWAARIVRGEVAEEGGGEGEGEGGQEAPLPSAEDYLASVAQRRESEDRRRARARAGVSRVLT